VSEEETDTTIGSEPTPTWIPDINKSNDYQLREMASKEEQFHVLHPARGYDHIDNKPVYYVGFKVHRHYDEEEVKAIAEAYTTTQDTPALLQNAAKGVLAMIAAGFEPNTKQLEALGLPSYEYFIVTNSGRLLTPRQLKSTDSIKPIFDPYDIDSLQPVSVNELDWSWRSIEQYCKRTSNPEAGTEGINLFDEMLAKLKYFVGMREKWMYYTTVLWVMASHLHPVFHAFAILYFYAPPGSGKTQSLDFIRLLAPYKRPLIVRATDAVIPRMIEAMRCPVFFDEKEELIPQGKNKVLSEKAQAILAYIDACYKKGGARTILVPAEGKKSAWIPKDFAVYTSCAVGNTRELPEAQMSRCIVMRMMRDDQYRGRTIREQDPVWQELKDALYTWCFGNVMSIAKIYADLRHDPIKDRFGSRQFEIVQPLIAIAKSIGLEEDRMNDLLNGLVANFSRSTAEDPDENVNLQVLSSLGFRIYNWQIFRKIDAPDYNDPVITCTDVADSLAAAFWSTNIKFAPGNRSVGIRLKKHWGLNPATKSIKHNNRNVKRITVQENWEMLRDLFEQHPTAGYFLTQSENKKWIISERDGFNSEIFIAQPNVSSDSGEDEYQSDLSVSELEEALNDENDRD